MKTPQWMQRGRKATHKSNGIAHGPLPQHVAVIMDGNGRWARSRSLPRTSGHRKGADAAQAVLKACGELDIPYLTLFAFSYENWQRPRDEIDELMELLRQYITDELSNLHDNNVRLRVIGDRSLLDVDIQEKIADAEQLTKNNSRMTLSVAVSYGGRQEIVHALKKLAFRVQVGEIPADELTEQHVRQCLYAPDIPDPDLLIRTGGDQRISNFLLWQMAYAELYFTETLWPDFDEEALHAAIQDYQQRERRFGKVGGLNVAEEAIPDSDMLMEEGAA